MPGAHALVVGKAGYEKVIAVTLKAGETATERVELLTEEEAAGTRRAVQRAQAERRVTEARLRQAEQEAERRRQRNRLALRATGFAVLAPPWRRRSQARCSRALPTARRRR
jgi:hypothetical protein